LGQEYRGVDLELLGADLEVHGFGAHRSLNGGALDTLGVKLRDCLVSIYL